MKQGVILLCLPALLVLGCGKAEPEKFSVTGTVTYQGKPLPVGSVLFVPKGKGQKMAASPIDAEGHYRLEAAPGEYVVQVQMVARLRGTPAPQGEGSQLDVPVVDWLIPEKYAHAETSGLKAVVKLESDNEINFDLE